MRNQNRRNMKKICMLACAWFVGMAVSASAAVVDTLQVMSEKMGRTVNVLVVSPDQVRGEGAPVVYLLNGHSGDERSWLGLKPEIQDYADRDNLIFVCPDGEDSWYWDSPLDKDKQFETFVSRELVAYVDSHYRTLPRREKRAITGYSMGGHGAMWLAIRHKDVFGAAGSMSGGVDIRPFPDNWNMKDRIGARDGGACNWDDYTAINQIERLRNGDLQLLIDCGYDDFFFAVNNAFHEELLKHGIMHDYIVRPGAHTGEYWNNSIDYHLLFFLKYFESPQPR